jgi:tetratricopeptide (TPR) repeat protein
MIEAVAFAQADLGDYVESVKTLDQIAKPSVRAEKQLNIAEKIIKDIEIIKKSSADKNEAVKQFDVTNLLRQSLAGAVEAKDAALESLVTIILARELAKQGKIDESKILFEKARKKAREVEEIEERNLVAIIIRSLIIVDRQAEALALIETINDEENKMLLLIQVITTLVQKNKIIDAINLVKFIKQNKIKEDVILNIIRNIAKTITVEQIFELAKQTSSPEFHKQLLQDTFYILLDNKRDDILEDFIKHLENVSENQHVFQYYQLKLLIDAKKFEEAAKFIKTFDSDSKLWAVHYFFLAEIQQSDGITEELLNLISEIHSEEEKKRILLFQQEVENVLKNNNTEEQLAGLFQVFQSQIQQEVFNLRGIIKILEQILELTEKLDDPCKIVKNRLDIADFQSRLYDKSGVKKNLNRLQQILDEIKDVSVFKELFSDDSIQPTQDVTENDKLFDVYTLITSIWYNIDENDEAKKTFQKAKDIADSESDVIRKVEKLLALSQLLAQTQFN